MVPFEYRIPDRIVQYYKLRYGREPQIGDRLPGPQGQVYEIVGVGPRPQKANVT